MGIYYYYYYYDHKTTDNRSAAKVYAQELVELVSQLDKEGKMPKILVASEHLAKVTLVKSALKPGDTAPLTSRIEDLEEIVKKLANSFENFQKKSEEPRLTFAAAVGGTGQGVGAAGLAGQGGQGHLQGGGAHDQRRVPLVQEGNGQNLRVPRGNGRDRSISPATKRAREETEQGTEAGAGGSGDGFTVPRRGRKTNYGKSTVTLEGVDAAPVEIFVGNTNPRATEEKVKEVLILSAAQLPDKPQLLINEVKCLNNHDVDPNPRTRCWRISVPYKFKELMANDNLYPAGWSHRRFYPARRKKDTAKKPHMEEGSDQQN